MDINKKILPLGEYFLMMLRTCKTNFLQLLATMLLYFLAEIVILIICFVPIAISVAHYVPSYLLQNPDVLVNYINSGDIINYIWPALPAIVVAVAVSIFMSIIVASVQYSMIYLIADSHVNNEKRKYGKMLAYSIKRAFPVTGTTVLLGLITMGIYLIFIFIMVSIATAMGLYTDLNTLLYTNTNDIFQPGLMAFSVIFFFLLIIMVCALIFVMVMYSMAVFARAKYKLSGIATLRYSRKLTKGKRGKIFGNLLLMSLIYLVISFILSFAAELATENYIPFVPFLVNLIIMFIMMLLMVFWSLMFINFDKVRGQEVLRSNGFKAGYIKDMYFPDKDADDTYEAENIKSEPGEYTPAAEVKADEKEMDKSPETSEEQAKEAPKEDNAAEEKQETAEQIIPDEKENNE